MREQQRRPRPADLAPTGTTNHNSRMDERSDYDDDLYRSRSPFAARAIPVAVGLLFMAILCACPLLTALLH